MTANRDYWESNGVRSGIAGKSCIACGQRSPERFGANRSRAVVVERGGGWNDRATPGFRPWKDSAGVSRETVSDHRGASQEGETR